MQRNIILFPAPDAPKIPKVSLPAFMAIFKEKPLRFFSISILKKSCSFPGKKGIKRVFSTLVLAKFRLIFDGSKLMAVRTNKEMAKIIITQKEACRISPASTAK